MTNGWEMSFISRSPCVVKLLNYIEAEIYQKIKNIRRIYPASVAHMWVGKGVISQVISQVNTE